MKKVTIEIETTNAAFGEDIYEAAREVVRILRSFGYYALIGPEREVPLRDINGNVCGQIRIE